MNTNLATDRLNPSVAQSYGRFAQLNPPFTRLERLGLVCILVTAFIPYPLNTILNLLEIAVAAFVLLSPVLSMVLRRNLGVFFVLSTSVFLGQLGGTSGLHEKTATLAFVKVCLYLCFIAILAFRCRCPDNRRFFLKSIVLPIAIVMCASAWFDTFTNTMFFAEWQTRFATLTSVLDRYNSSSLDEWLEFLDEGNLGSGFASRPWHLLPWAMCGLIALMTVRSHGEMKTRWFWPILLLLFFTPLLVPQRNAVIGVGAASVVYLIAAKKELHPRTRRHVFIGMTIAVAAFVALQPWLGDLRAHYALEERGNLTALAKWLSVPFTGDISTYDPRFEMFVRDAEWLLANPLYLFFGTGWNIPLVPSVKPHNLYIGLVVSAGLLGVTALLFFLRRQIVEQVQGPAVWSRTSAITKAGLWSLALVGISDGYLTGRLGVPATFLSLWITLCVIAARAPSRQIQTTGLGKHRDVQLHNSKYRGHPIAHPRDRQATAPSGSNHTVLVPGDVGLRNSPVRTRQ